ncbi:hypothetical protein LCGC14_1466330 [marine sediment metagenome]|uniref:Uncharacterized protein n=1 Tax=marine sediment metagenome TaxID=412755 RepID=A0A0F9LUB4_9ZZZZ|nr:MAG: hypothetical protein Lokiarch_34860 [Candidatus Lokiarchaeum sp. GC14_75]HEC39893.1 hypothetical protein [bacterium]
MKEKFPSNKDLKKIFNNENLIVENQVETKKVRFYHKYLCSFWYFIIGLFGFTTALLVSELTVSYIIVLSLTIGIFSTIGLLIYYVEFKSYKKDLSKTTTEVTFEGVKITESVKGGKNTIIILILFIIVFWIYASIAIIIGLGGIIKALLFLIILWIVIGLIIFMFYRLFLKGTSELRKFIVNENFIEIIVPPQPIFHVNWVDIDRIKLSLKPYKKLMNHNYPDRYIYIYELNFIDKDYNQTFEILGGRDFSKKLNEIFDLLEKYAIKMNKEFIDFVRTDTK